MKIKIQEGKFNKIVDHLLNEEKTSNKKERCISTNVVSLNDIVGPQGDYQNYTSDLYKRSGGVNGIADTIDILKTLRLHPEIKDGGEHLSYELMNNLNNFRGKNYFDETNRNCLKSMDKVIELYRENEHGEDLVKDIQKVLGHIDPSPRAKEYLKRCQVLIREK